MERRAGVFVSLHKGGELRGCIGHIEADQPLARVIPALRRRRRQHRSAVPAGDRRRAAGAGHRAVAPRAARADCGRRTRSRSAATAWSSNAAGSAACCCRRSRPSGAGTREAFLVADLPQGRACRATPGRPAPASGGSRPKCSESAGLESGRPRERASSGSCTSQRIAPAIASGRPGLPTSASRAASAGPRNRRSLTMRPKRLEADASLADVRVAIDAAAERPLRVVQVKHLQPIEADEPPEFRRTSRA